MCLFNQGSLSRNLAAIFINSTATGESPDSAVIGMPKTESAQKTLNALNPVTVNDDPSKDTFSVRALALPQGLSQERIVARDNTVTYDSRSLQLPESRVRAHYVKAASRSANTPTACSPCSTGRGCWRATTPIVNPSKENESVRRPPRDPLRRGELEPCGFVDSRFAPAHKLHKANSRSKPKRTNDVPRKPVNSECYRQREAGRAPAGCVLSRDGRRSMRSPAAGDETR